MVENIESKLPNLNLDSQSNLNSLTNRTIRVSSYN